MRASACPSLLHIVSALDGGICRIKLPCGQLTATQAEAVATASARYASGIIEITNRANLQIRGIQPAHADALVAALLDAGLGSATPGADDVRNVMVSPSAGIDSAGLLDTTPLATQILALLQTQAHLHALSPKFSISLDGGEALAMLEHPHDLWFSAMPTTDKKSHVSFVFGLAGSPAQSVALAAVSAEHVVALVDAVLNTFLDLATSGQARMRQLLQTVPIQTFLKQVQSRLPFALSSDVSGWSRRSLPPHAHIGIHAQRDASHYYVGAVPSLGRINTTQLRALAQFATRFGNSIIRLTPWQSVLLPNITQASAEIVLRKLKQKKFSTTVAESMAHLIACTGSRGCSKGLADTKADAVQLAHVLQEKRLNPVVHLSGCQRSCAAAFVAPLTLLARSDGRYDFFRRDENTADFGKQIATDIDIAQAVTFLKNRSLWKNIDD